MLPFFIYMMMTLEDLKNAIHDLSLTIKEEDVKRHDSEWKSLNGFTDKSGYSSRENLDSEYVEEYLASMYPELEKITRKPNKFFADISFGNYQIDFKEIAGEWFNTKHDFIRYFDAVDKGLLTHFLFYRTNRPRGDNNFPLVISPNTILKCEFLCVVTPHILFSCRMDKYNRISVNDILKKAAQSKDCLV